MVIQPIRQLQGPLTQAVAGVGVGLETVAIVLAKTEEQGWS